VERVQLSATSATSLVDYSTNFRCDFRFIHQLLCFCVAISIIEHGFFRVSLLLEASPQMYTINQQASIQRHRSLKCRSQEARCHWCRSNGIEH
jgi:hypothetical protein